MSFPNTLKTAFPKNSSALLSEPWGNTSKKSISSRHLSSLSNHIILLLRVLSLDNIHSALSILNFTCEKLDEFNPNKSSEEDENIACDIQ